MRAPVGPRCHAPARALQELARLARLVQVLHHVLLRAPRPRNGASESLAGPWARPGGESAYHLLVVAHGRTVTLG